MTRNLSWREIDKLREKPRRREVKSALERALERDPRLKKKYLEEAEKLFMGPKGSPEHSKDLQAIHDKYGTKDFKKVVKKYISRYGMPDDWSTLILLLDVKDPSIITNAIKELLKQSKNKNSIEKKGVISKLKVISMTETDPSILETVEQALAEL